MGLENNIGTWRCEPWFSAVGPVSCGIGIVVYYRDSQCKILSRALWPDFQFRVLTDFEWGMRWKEARLEQGGPQRKVN